MPPRFRPLVMASQLLDNFQDISDWTAVTSGRARLIISQSEGLHGNAMRLDFDFQGGGGFVVARKVFHMKMPDTYAFSFLVRGAAPLNNFEFKLTNPTGRSVWRWQREGFEFPRDWTDE
jgi:hypothetical protein